MGRSTDRRGRGCGGSRRSFARGSDRHRRRVRHDVLRHRRPLPSVGSVRASGPAHRGPVRGNRPKGRIELVRFDGFVDRVVYLEFENWGYHRLRLWDAEEGYLDSFWFESDPGMRIPLDVTAVLDRDRYDIISPDVLRRSVQTSDFRPDLVFQPVVVRTAAFDAADLERYALEVTVERGAGLGPVPRPHRGPGLTMPPREAGTAGRRHAWCELLVVTGLSGFAVSLPMLSVLGDNPIVFTSREVEGATLVAYVLAVAFVPPLVLWGVGCVAYAIDAAFRPSRSCRNGRVARRPDRRATGQGALARPVRCRGGAVSVGRRGVRRRVRTLRVGRHVGPLHRPAAVPRGRPFHRCVSIRRPAPRPAPEAADDTDAGELPSVVMIVLDEFPTKSILDTDGVIDEVRFPHLAQFASGASWYRHHTSLSPYTESAIPSLLTGNVPQVDQALWTNYPDSVFSLLARPRAGGLRDRDRAVWRRRMRANRGLRWSSRERPARNDGSAVARTDLVGHRPIAGARRFRGADGRVGFQLRRRDDVRGPPDRGHRPDDAESRAGVRGRARWQQRTDPLLPPPHAAPSAVEVLPRRPPVPGGRPAVGITGGGRPEVPVFVERLGGRARRTTSPAPGPVHGPTARSGHGRPAGPSAVRRVARDRDVRSRRVVRASHQRPRGDGVDARFRRLRTAAGEGARSAARQSWTTAT